MGLMGDDTSERLDGWNWKYRFDRLTVFPRLALTALAATV